MTSEWTNWTGPVNIVGTSITHLIQQRVASVLIRSFVILCSALLIVSCRGTTPSQDSSDTKIINGDVVPAGSHAAIVPLRYENGKLACSGSFIGPNLILTAQHCVGATVYYEGTEPLRVWVNSTGGVKGVHNADTAVLEFEEHLAPATLQIHDGPIEPDAPFTIVGFGCTAAGTDEGTGTKREGHSRVSQVYSGADAAIDGAIFAKGWEPTGPHSNLDDTCVGDSGGPLLIDGKIAGVTSGGLLGPNDRPISVYANLTSMPNRSFLIGLKEIGVLPQNTQLSTADLPAWRFARLRSLKQTPYDASQFHHSIEPFFKCRQNIFSSLGTLQTISIQPVDQPGYDLAKLDWRANANPSNSKLFLVRYGAFTLNDQNGVEKHTTFFGRFVFAEKTSADASRWSIGIGSGYTLKIDRTNEKASLADSNDSYVFKDADCSQPPPLTPADLFP